MAELNINTDDSSLSFLYWLVTIKRFEAMDICRVVEKPHQNNELYNQYLEEIGGTWEQ